jgi:hypothetical protein
MRRNRPPASLITASTLLVVVGCGPPPSEEGVAETAPGGEQPEAGFSPDEQAIQAREGYYARRGVLGEESPKIRRSGDSVFVWAGGGESGPGAEWFDFTGAPMDPAKLQYGIGADRIESVDEPVFVEADDPRLLDIPPSPYRPEERPTTVDEIPVIGYLTDAGEARAYPTALLDQHEVVNDVSGRGKPFTVGW